MACEKVIQESTTLYTRPVFSSFIRFFLLFPSLHLSTSFGCSINCDPPEQYRACVNGLLGSDCSGFIGCLHLTQPCGGECPAEYPVVSEDGLSCRPTQPAQQNRPTPKARPKDDNDLCSSKIDAIVQTSDGSSYVFKGDNYWKLTSDRVASGYPRKISQDWPGLPGDIDAALTWKKNGVTYFFKGDQYWRFSGQSPSPGYPKDISNWPRLPSRLDAAFEWGRNENLYFFKGSQYWKYDTDLLTMADGYPREISTWQNVPGNVDAAFQWKNGKTYFFKSGNYWRFNDKTAAVDKINPTFPRDAGQWWFGCPKKRQNIPFVDATDPGYVEKVDTEH